MQVDTLLDAVNNSQQEMYNKGTETVVETTVAETAAPATEAPVTTTTTTPETTPVTEPKFDATEFAKQTFGTDNLEDVKTKYTGYGQVLSEKEQLAAKYAELEKEVPTDDLEKFVISGLRKGIPLNFLEKIHKMDVEKMSNEDKVKNWMAIEKPYLTPEQINVLYKKDYEVNPDAIDAAEEKILKDAQLADAAHKAGQGLKDWTNKTMNPAPAKAQEVQAQESEKDLQARTAAWKAVAPKLESAVKEVSKTIPIAMFDTKAGEEKQHELKYAVPADRQQKYINLAIDNYIKAGVTVNDQTIGEITAYAQRIMKSEEAENMAIAFAESAISVFLQDFKTRFNNTNLRQEPQTGVTKASTETEAQVRSLVSKM